MTISKVNNNFSYPKEIKQVDVISLTDKLKKYNEKFYSESKNSLGYIEEVQVPINCKLVVKADIHGDFISLSELLDFLILQGYIDQNLKIRNEWKGKFIMIFLGDYIDRGSNSWEVVDKLIDLKMINPDDVFLLRGNHEDLRVSFNYVAGNQGSFYLNKDFKSEIVKFFSSLTSILNIHSGKGSGLFTHGSILIDEDIFDVVDSSLPRFKREIEIKDVSISDRILNLLPPNFRNKKLKDITKNEINSLQNISLLKPLYWIEAALRIQDFILNYKTQIKKDRDNQMSTLGWGDVDSQQVPGPNHFRGRGMKLTPGLIKDYFIINSSQNNELSILVKGHGHLEKVSSRDGENIIFMLPVAGEIEYFDKDRPPRDISYIFTTQEEMRKWTLEKTIRERKSTITNISPPVNFLQKNLLDIQRKKLDGLVNDNTEDNSSSDEEKYFHKSQPSSTLNNKSTVVERDDLFCNEVFKTNDDPDVTQKIKKQKK